MFCAHSVAIETAILDVLIRFGSLTGSNAHVSAPQHILQQLIFCIATLILAVMRSC